MKVFMYSGARETQCTHCNHLQVCSFKAQFLVAQKEVDDVRVITGNGSVINLRDISWIRPVSLECSYFSGKTPVMRDANQDTIYTVTQ